MSTPVHHAVVISGPAGVGKSTRDEAILRRSDGRSPTWDLDPPRVPHLAVDALLPVTDQVTTVFTALPAAATEAP
ncbi:MAG: hypothetical protein Q4D89_10690 [Arachnia propionica]|uniref:hypothetical protein n=1 Tax=Arachnia propionica TaxID=1750 RepID=UPI0026F4C56E|nr:hypothetical protein [Arachnia propionica]